MGPRDRGGIRHNSHSPKSTTRGMVQRAGRRFEGASLRLQRVQGVLALPGMGNRRRRLLHCSGNEQQGPHEGDRRCGRRPHLFHRCERARAVRELEGACWPDLGDKDRGDRDACLEGNFSVFPGPGQGVGTLVCGREHPLSCLQGLDGGGGVKMLVQDVALRWAGLFPKVSQQAQSMCRRTQSSEKLETEIFMWFLLFLDVSN